MCKDYKLSKIKDFTKECAEGHYWANFEYWTRQEKYTWNKSCEVWKTSWIGKFITL